MSGNEGSDVGKTVSRLEEIAETLEEGEVSLETAKQLRLEADEYLEELRDTLDVGDGDIIEIEGNDVDIDTVD